MLNINYGHNKELLNACRPLGEYAWFIEKIRQRLYKNIKRNTENCVFIL